MPLGRSRNKRPRVIISVLPASPYFSSSPGGFSPGLNPLNSTQFGSTNCLAAATRDQRAKRSQVKALTETKASGRRARLRTSALRCGSQTSSPCMVRTKGQEAAPVAPGARRMKRRARNAAGSRLMCPQMSRSKPFEGWKSRPAVPAIGPAGLRRAHFAAATVNRNLPPRPAVIHVSLAGNVPGAPGISRGSATTSAQAGCAHNAPSRSRVNLEIPPWLPNASGMRASTRSDREPVEAMRHWRAGMFHATAPARQSSAPSIRSALCVAPINASTGISIMSLAPAIAGFSSCAVFPRARPKNGPDSRNRAPA